MIVVWAQGHVVPAPAWGEVIEPDANRLPGLAARVRVHPRTAFVAVVPVLTYNSISVVMPDARTVYENACAIPRLLSA